MGGFAESTTDGCSCEKKTILIPHSINNYQLFELISNDNPKIAESVMSIKKTSYPYTYIAY